MSYGVSPPVIKYKKKPEYAEFDGVEDYIDCNKSIQAVIATSDFTYSLWVNGTDWASDNRLIGQYKNTDNRMNIEYDGGTLYRKEIVGGVAISGSHFAYSFTDNIWYYIVWVVEQGDVGGDRIYINGDLEDTSDSANSGDVSNIDADFTIGKYSSNYFNGQIKGVNVYNKALSQAEITSLYAGDEVTDGLVAKYDLDGNAQDSSGNALHGTENGGINYPKPTETIDLPKLARNGRKEVYPKTRYFTNILGELRERKRAGRFTAEYDFLETSGDRTALRDSLNNMYNTTSQVQLYPNDDSVINYAMLVTDLQFTPHNGLNQMYGGTIKMSSIRNNIVRRTTADFEVILINFRRI